MEREIENGIAAMQTAFNVSLKEKALNKGLTRTEMNEVYNKMTGIAGIPIEIIGKNTKAVGLINIVDADLLGYDYSIINDLVTEMLNDTDTMPDMEYFLPSDFMGKSWIYLNREDFTKK